MKDKEIWFDSVITLKQMPKKLFGVQYDMFCFVFNTY